MWQSDGGDACGQRRQQLGEVSMRRVGRTCGAAVLFAVSMVLLSCQPPPIGTITRFGASIPTVTSVAAASDGHMWATSPATQSLVVLDPAIGSFVSLTGQGIDQPASIVSGPDGNLWFVNSTASIGR